MSLPSKPHTTRSTSPSESRPEAASARSGSTGDALPIFAVCGEDFSSCSSAVAAKHLFNTRHKQRCRVAVWLSRESVGLEIGYGAEQAPIQLHKLGQSSATRIQRPTKQKPHEHQDVFGIGKVNGDKRGIFNDSVDSQPRHLFRELRGWYGSANKSESQTPTLAQAHGAISPFRDAS